MWVLIGVDPGPPHPPYPLRLLLLLATISFHAFFGLALMTGDTVLAPDWWASIERTDQAALVADQHLGGGIAWAIGELPTLAPDPDPRRSCGPGTTPARRSGSTARPTATATPS